MLSAHNASRHRARLRRISAVTLATTLGLTGLALAPAASAADEPVNITIATINDFHGRIEADQKSAGIAAISTAVKNLRAQNPNTVFAAAGDLIGASTFTSFIQNDQPTIDGLNAAGLDVSATGNHEFDQGFADLRDRVIPAADWEYLNANVYLAGTQDRALAPSWVKEIEGINVGFIGAVTEDLPSLVTPQGMAGLEVRSIVDSVNSAAADLKDGDPANGEADVIVLLVHEGATTADVASITPDSPLGEIVYGVDKSVNAIVSAHTHLAYNHVIDGRPVVSAGQYGENMGIMQLQVDPTTKQIVSISNTIRVLTSGGKPIDAADPAVVPIVDAAKAEALIKGAVHVGDTTGDLNRARFADGTTENRGGESTLGNFVSDVQRDVADADISFMNPGGLRTDIKYASSAADDPDGNITYREAAMVQPFANTLVKMNMTGAQIKTVLEQQWQPAGSSRSFLKLGVSSGFTYTYDPTAAAGAHITRIMLDGAELDPAGTYSVVVNSFLATGGDNFFEFANGSGAADTGKTDLAAMVEWFDANGAVTPDASQRAVGVVMPTAPAGGYVEADEVAVALSSLAFSTTEAKPTEVVATIGGLPAGRAAIDAAPVDATDEGGKAALTVTIPPGVWGEQTLTLTAGATVIELPILLGPEPQRYPEIELNVDTIQAGGKVGIAGYGFESDAVLTIELHSDPVKLGTMTAGAAGDVKTTVVIPESTPAGEHTVVVLDANGKQLATASLTVTAAATQTPTPTEEPTHVATTKPGGALADTGADVVPLLALGLIVLAAGIAVVVMRRRTHNMH